jgi:cytochrome c oxidase subunit II
MKNKALKTLTVLFTALILSVALFGCVSEQKQVTKADTNTLVPSGKLVNGVRVIAVQAKRFEFMPNTIVVKAGEKVQLDMTSLDDAHGISLPAFKISQDILPGKTSTVTFTAGAVGSYPFHCSVFCGFGHLDMKGEIVVIAAK